MIDPAMVRPGRLDKLLYVDLPSPVERIEILKTHLKKTPLQPGGWEGVAEIVSGESCDGFSGADMAALVREAATLALRSALERDGAFENDNDPLDGSGMALQRPRVPAQFDIAVTVEHFRVASQKTLPSVSREQRRKYEMLRNKFAGLPTRGGKKWAEEKGLAERGLNVAKTADDGAATVPNGADEMDMGQPALA
jgi:ribosome biogenesis ATPase